jgi:hypothetical protein
MSRFLLPLAGSTVLLIILVAGLEHAPEKKASFPRP